MSIKTSSAKSKGRKLQQWVAKTIQTILNIHEDDAISTGMGQPGVDVKLSKSAQEKFPCAVECKNTKSFPGLAALRQAKENCKEGLIPVVFYHCSRSSLDETIVFLYATDYINLFKEENVKET